MFSLLALAAARIPQAPQPWGPLPTEMQAQYQDEELSAFIHYGMNTYTEVEWGTGKEDENLFKPTALDTDQWVKTLKECGFKRIIMIGRHHDGFCIWKSQYTKHQVNASKEFQETSKKLGQSGDVIEELSKSCTKYDMNMGFYLSPWDANSPYYGKEVEYNEYYMNQLTEVLGGKKYGNNGRFVEVWMDGAKGTGAAAQIYWFDKWFELIEKLQPGAVVFSPYGSTVRWIGNEAGKAGDPCWSRINKTYQREYYDIHGGDDAKYLQHGDPVGDIYSVGECDVSITGGWFWKEGRTPKSMKELTDIYFHSVGLGQPFLLNVPPNKEGKLPQNFVDRLYELARTINGSFEHNFAADNGVKIEATSGNGEKSILYDEKNMIKKDNSFWAVDDGSFEAKILVDFKKSVTFDVVAVSENIRLGQRITEIEVLAHVGTTWKSFGNATTVGAKRLFRNTAITADQIVIKIKSGQANPTIKFIGVYKAIGEFAMGDGFPAGLDYKDHTVLEASGKWTEEEDGSNKWTNEKGASLSVKFTGSKAWVSGTKDPGHGDMEVYLDGTLIDTVSTKDKQRQLGVLLYSSKDFAYGEHTLKVVNKDKSLGIKGFYFLPNEGAGMFEIEQLDYSVMKGNSVTLTINRVGGSKGTANVTFQTTPNTAVHGRHYIDVIENLQFKDGETTKKVTVKTINHTEAAGNLTFFGQIVTPVGKAILGFNVSSIVTIIDLTKFSSRWNLVQGKTPSSNEKSKFNITLILGIVGAAVAVIVIIAVVLNLKKNQTKEEFNEEPLLNEEKNNN